MKNDSDSDHEEPAKVKAIKRQLCKELLEKAKSSDSPLDHLQKAIETCPKDAVDLLAEIHINIGLIHLKQENQRLAWNAFNLAIENKRDCL